MHEPELLTKTNGLMRSGGDEFTDEFSDEIGKMSGRVIDIGTGAGDVSVDFILPKLNPNSTLLCSDISEAMVNYGKKTYGHDKRLSFMVLDIETPNLPRNLIGQFDHVTSLYCLHWCNNLRRAFENIYALLRPGGTSFVTFVASYPAFEAYPVLKAMPRYAPYMTKIDHIIPPFQRVDRPRRPLMRLLCEVGFQVQSCSSRQMNYIFKTYDELRDLFFAADPSDIKSMPNNIKEEYKIDLANEIAKRGIVFNKHAKNENEFSTLISYRAFVVYLKKPLDDK